MNYKTKNLEKNQVEIEISISKEEWKKMLEEAYQKEKGKYSITGFRKGKAPRKVIEKTYGEGVFFDTAINEAFYNSYVEILSKQPELEPIETPTLDIKSLDDKGLVMVSKVTTMPVIELGEYKGLKIEVTPKEVSDKDVEHELEHIKEHHVRFVELDAEQTIKNGNIANIDFNGFIDGKTFDGGSAQGHDLEIGSHSFIDTFEDQLLGLKAGDEKDVVVKFPADYGAKEFAGKDATFKVKINAIKDKQYPELNDAFASDVSEYETLAEYKESIKKDLIAKSDKDAKTERENKIIDKIVENSSVDIPDSMIDKELVDIMQEFEYRLMYQGIKLEDYAKYTNTTVDEIRKSKRDEAVKSIKIRMALSEIVKREKITISDSEVDAKIEEMSKNTKKPLEEIKKFYDEQRLNYLKNEILMGKLLNLLNEYNK